MSDENHLREKVVEVATQRTFPIIFLGLADHVQEGGGPFPVNPIDLFRLSQFKSHLLYPVSMDGYFWVFLIHQEILDSQDAIELKMRSEDGKCFWKLAVSTTDPLPFPTSTASGAGSATTSNTATSASVTNSAPRVLPTAVTVAPKTSGATLILKSKEVKWLMLTAPFSQDAMPVPGKYLIEGTVRKQEETLGEVHFLYHKVPPFTLDQMKAIEANPHSVKALKMYIGCKECPSKIFTYSALEHHQNLEDEGCIWYADLPDYFKCDCGQTNQSLMYVRENLHALLGRDIEDLEGRVSYVRRYGHSEIKKVIETFQKLLDSRKDEAAFQSFLEEHPVMLAQFHVRKLITKPTILGKFFSDFAAVDSQNNLLLIELEKPGMKLFKKDDGHPTADLHHAYAQIQDWKNQYARHPVAVLEGLGLKAEEIMAVKGVVIGGRTKGENQENMRRHRSQPIYPDISFFTYDELSASLQEISRKLA